MILAFLEVIIAAFPDNKNGHCSAFLDGAGIEPVTFGLLDQSQQQTSLDPDRRNPHG